MLKHVSIGESITSEPIQMNFHDSIGKSSLILMYYPKGQYIGSSDDNVIESGRASVYLKMVNCENKNESLATIVTVFIKSPYSDSNDEFATTKFAVLLYHKLNERWIGPLNLADTEELYSKRSKKLFSNDALTIGCELNDTTFRSSVPRPRSMDEKKSVAPFRFPVDSKSDILRGHVKWTSIVGSELNDTPPSSLRSHSKGVSHSEVPSNCDVKDDPSEGRSRKIKLGQRSPSTFRNDVMKENLNIPSQRSPSNFRNDVTKENQNIRSQRSSSSFRNDVMKENVSIPAKRYSLPAFRKDVMKENGSNKNVCRCGKSDQKVSRETQTWNERLMAHACTDDNIHAIKVETEKAPQISNQDKGYRVKDTIEFFEKYSLPRD